MYLLHVPFYVQAVFHGMDTPRSVHSVVNVYCFSFLPVMIAMNVHAQIEAEAGLYFPPIDTWDTQKAL